MIMESMMYFVSCEGVAQLVFLIDSVSCSLSINLIFIFVSHFVVFALFRNIYVIDETMCFWQLSFLLCFCLFAFILLEQLKCASSSFAYMNVWLQTKPKVNRDCVWSQHYATIQVILIQFSLIQFLAILSSMLLSCAPLRDAMISLVVFVCDDLFCFALLYTTCFCVFVWMYVCLSCDVTSEPLSIVMMIVIVNIITIMEMHELSNHFDSSSPSPSCSCKFKRQSQSQWPPCLRMDVEVVQGSITEGRQSHVSFSSHYLRVLPEVLLFDAKVQVAYFKQCSNAICDLGVELNIILTFVQ
jgi:hypothetical protein